MQLEDIGSPITNIKIKSNKTIIEFGTLKFKILTETFNHFNLKIGQIVDKKLAHQINVYEQVEEIILYAKNICLKKPLTTEKQLFNILINKFGNTKEVKKAFNILKVRNFINDESFLEAVLVYFDQENYGKYYIVNYLTINGVDKDVINRIKFDYENEKRKTINYFNEIKNKCLHKSFAKQKRQIYDLMLKRGFPVEVVIEVIENLKIDIEQERKQLIKEYKKLKSKIMKSENFNIDYESKIVNKLIDKGYTLKMIGEVIILDKEKKLDD